MKKEIVRWSKIVFNNFIAIPRIAKEELDPYEFKLYAHYIDESRWNSSLSSGVRETAKSIGIGKNTVSPARKSLQDKGYLTITEGINSDDPDIIVLDSDIWRRNSEQYDTPEKHQERALEALEMGDLSDDTLDKLEEILRKAGRVPDQGQRRPESGTDSYIKSLNVPKGTFSPASGTTPPVVTGRTTGNPKVDQQIDINGYAPMERWLFEAKAGDKPLSSSQRTQLDLSTSYLNEKKELVEGLSPNNLFESDPAYQVWLTEEVLVYFKRTKGAAQPHYKPAATDLILNVRKLEWFYSWRSKNQSRFENNEAPVINERILA